jgi:TetR/AcrR family transcriptional regulator, transcriptional repressor for nem operon
VARPREFDRDEALAKAIKVFASHGFEGASTEMLLNGMGISRQSMYDTFGDKRRLYLEALQRYSSDSTAEIIGTMHSRASALEGIETALLAFAARPASETCLGVSATTEFGRTDRSVCAITDASGATLMASFERVIRKGQAAGELAPDLDPKSGARFLVSMLLGLKVSARSGATLDALRGIARIALRSLR